MAKSSLDKKFDQIRKREEEKTFSTKKRSRIVNKFLNNRLAVLGLIIFTIIILASIFAPLLSPYDPMRVDLRSMRQPPSFDHWFGTDSTGRDVFTRVLFWRQSFNIYRFRKCYSISCCGNSGWLLRWI